MILGSHNSWSFLPPRKWWQKALAFTARCQRLNIQEQYALGVRCFDLRLKLIGKHWHVVHNSFDYGLLDDVMYDLGWLHRLCREGSIYIRVLHDVRRRKDYTLHDVTLFIELCRTLTAYYPDFKFWCGRNLYNWHEDYTFDFKPQCTEMYSSVCSPRIIDDWFPLMYAKRNNAWIRREEYKPDEILLIDFVDIS